MRHRLARSRGSGNHLLHGRGVDDRRGRLGRPHTYLVARTSNPSANTITEQAATFTRGACAEGSGVVKIDGNHISMSAGGMEGNGELTGQALGVDVPAPRIRRPASRPQDRRLQLPRRIPDSIQGHKDFIRCGAEQLRK